MKLVFFIISLFYSNAFVQWKRINKEIRLNNWLPGMNRFLTNVVQLEYRRQFLTGSGGQGLTRFALFVLLKWNKVILNLKFGKFLFLYRVSPQPNLP